MQKKHLQLLFINAGFLLLLLVIVGALFISHKHAPAYAFAAPLVLKLLPGSVHLDTVLANTTNPDQRPRTEIIKTAPSIILLIAACVLAAISVVFAIILFIKRTCFKQEQRFFMFWCVVIVAIYATAVTYVCASQNQFVYKRTATDAVFSPFIVNNALTWMLALFLVTQFCEVTVPATLSLLIIGALGLSVQSMASFADNGVQWGIYVLGSVPLFSIPFIVFVSMQRKRKSTDSKDYFSLVVIIAVMCFIKLMYTVTDLAGHSFGGRYHGLGISDEVALQVLQNALLIFFMQILSCLTLSPGGSRLAAMYAATHLHSQAEASSEAGLLTSAAQELHSG